MHYNNGLPSFESLPFESAVLDANGIIIAVNNAWRTFAEANGGNRLLQEGVGLDYLSVCRAAHGERSEEAPLATASIVSSLEGRQPRSTFHYPCHSAAVNRWFLCTTSPSVTDAVNMGVIISHVQLFNVHQQASPDKHNDLDEHQYRRNAISIWDRRIFGEESQDLLIYAHLQQETSTGCWQLDRSLRSLRWTTESYRIHEASPATFEATYNSMLSLYSPKNRSLLESLFLQLANSGAPFEVELPSFTSRRRRIWIRMTGRAEIHGARIGGLYGTMQDVTARRDLQKQLAIAIRSRRAGPDG